MKTKKPNTVSAILFLVTVLAISNAKSVLSWSNGGFSSDPSNPAYGTHDWAAQHALDWLPVDEKQYITDNLASYLYGTELPDNNNASAPGHIGDTTKHHVYFHSNGALQDDAAAIRASEEFQLALNYLNAKNYTQAALTAGTMTHYIADVGVWAHVMAASTDWGSETGNNHSNYENYVNGRTSDYVDDFNSYLLFDGKLDEISAYNATIDLANDSTFDHGGIYTCVWMNNHYNASNPIYWNRAGESLNLAVNYVADVLHTLYVNSNQTMPSQSPIPTFSPTPIASITTIPPLTPTASQTISPTLSPTTPAIPEFSPWVPLFVVATATALLLGARKRVFERLHGCKTVYSNVNLNKYSNELG